MRIAAAALFLLLVAAYSFSMDLRATRGSSITADEPFYVLTAQSLLEDGDLDLRQQYERRSYESFFDHPAGLWRQSVPLPDGTLLSPHDPGLSLLIVPGFALAGLGGVQAELLLLAALTFTLTFVLVAAETRAPLLSWLVTAAVALSATAFVYATEVYPEIPAALLLVASLLVVRGARPGLPHALGLAALLTALAWLGVKYVPLAAIVGAFFVLRAPRTERLAFIGSSAASAGLYVWGHLALFGALTPYSVSTVYEGAGTLEVLRSHLGFADRAYRLYGLFIDRDFGIGRWAPILLLVPVALPVLMRAGSTARLAAGLVVAQLLVATFVAITMMGWWFPGRTLMTVFPLFAVAIALLLQRVPRLGTLAAVGAGWSVLVTAALALAASRGELTLAVDPFDLAFPLFRLPGAAFPSYTAWGPDTVLLTLAWLALGGAGMYAVVRAERTRSRRAPARATALAGGAGSLGARSP
ncbi:MAG: hypothetical protein ACRDGT_01825 [Candidatus Limnocylindria bacterium]